MGGVGFRAERHPPQEERRPVAGAQRRRLAPPKTESRFCFGMKQTFAPARQPRNGPWGNGFGREFVPLRPWLAVLHRLAEAVRPRDRRGFLDFHHHLFPHAEPIEELQAMLSELERVADDLIERHLADQAASFTVFVEAAAEAGNRRLARPKNRIWIRFLG